MLALPVEGFSPAALAVPVSGDALLLVVATHGAGGEPEPTCEAWARRTRGRALIVCPRGRAVSQLEARGFYYPDHHALEAEVLASVVAVQRKYGARLAPQGALYTGYSQGATMGALFLPPHAARFPTLVLTEGGSAEWTLASARAFHAAGGARVLFVCGTRHCAANATKSAQLLERAQVPCRVENVPGGGHTDEAEVGARLDALMSWALSGQD